MVIMENLILASQSPRRRELLALAGIRFTVRARPVEEILLRGESPIDYVRRLACAKAAAAWGRDGEIVLGADTVVVLGDDVLEKPADAADARRMLRALSGREHTVVTGVCFRRAGAEIVDFASTMVRFVALDA